MKKQLNEDLQSDITKFENDIKKLEEDLSDSPIKEETYKSSLDRFKSFALKISIYNKLYEVRNEIKSLLIRPFQKSNKISLRFTIFFGAFGIIFGISGMIIGYIGLKEQRTSSKLIQEKDQTIIDQSSRINELQKQFIEEFRGGDSYCYISPISFKNGLLLQLVNGGDYTVYGVRVRIFDIEYITRPSNFKYLNKMMTSFEGGNIRKNETRQIGLLPIDEKSSQQRYNLSISAPNGFIGQKIFLRKCYNEKRKSFRWCIAYRVTRDSDKNILKEYIDKDFPLSDGEAIWDW